MQSDSQMAECGKKVLSSKLVSTDFHQGYIEGYVQATRAGELASKY